MSATGLIGGYAGDRLLGDPRRLHPVAGFGRLALALESLLYAPSRIRGIAYTGTLVGLAGLAAEVAARIPRCRPAVLALVTWASLGGRSLSVSARRLARHVEQDDIAGARALLPGLCGRDPDALDADGLTRAALESVAENTSDAVVGALFWAALAGPGGVAAYRAANTLDAMVGHRNERYRCFGWASARLDDALNWLPARLSVGLTAICAPLVGGSPRAAWETARRDGAAHPSPNAGRVEAAFAGALGVQLGGPLSYGGMSEHRAVMGAGRAPTPADVERAARLSLAVGAAAAVSCSAARAAVERRASAGVRA